MMMMVVDEEKYQQVLLLLRPSEFIIQNLSPHDLWPKGKSGNHERTSAKGDGERRKRLRTSTNKSDQKSMVNTEIDHLLNQLKNILLLPPQHLLTCPAEGMESPAWVNRNSSPPQ